MSNMKFHRITDEYAREVLGEGFTAKSLGLASRAGRLKTAKILNRLFTTDEWIAEFLENSPPGRHSPREAAAGERMAARDAAAAVQRARAAIADLGA
jgi:hypothetical protein